MVQMKRRKRKVLRITKKQLNLRKLHLQGKLKKQIST